ncbi:MAG: hypothetical protein PHW18_02580 [Sulfuricurvum sp.]|uniref:hypothetical protein n=1 Tax=Sulfuricurvum sp. TaxID=2025608 RepID=UPI0026073E1C|nr:hypothetical protein [Sulfuricurvum sp.]MDD2828442.1 hypothetical protein [Sulfuricurvum sp.]MDD4949447.1 hypothetical protein [Sulfuricurvum sp.]
MLHYETITIKKTNGNYKFFDVVKGRNVAQAHTQERASKLYLKRKKEGERNETWVWLETPLKPSKWA